LPCRDVAVTPALSCSLLHPSPALCGPSPTLEIFGDLQNLETTNQSKHNISGLNLEKQCNSSALGLDPTSFSHILQIQGCGKNDVAAYELVRLLKFGTEICISHLVPIHTTPHATHHPILLLFHKQAMPSLGHSRRFLFVPLLTTPLPFKDNSPRC
jgi:hypothetical protein